MLSNVLSATLVLSLLVAAAPVAHAAPKGTYVNVVSGGVSHRVFKASMHHYPVGKKAAVSSSRLATSTGCYEPGANGALVPCRSP